MSEQVVSTEEIDLVLKKYAEARAEHEFQKKLAAEKYKEREEAETELMLIMTKAGKSKWEVPGVGSVSSYETSSVRVPEDAASNKEFFDYIVEQHGLDFAMEKFRMHSASINSYYNEEYDRAEDKALFQIPGVGAPVSKPTLRFKKA